MSQRRKVLYITGRFLLGLFWADVRWSYEVTKDGLPPDATIIDMQFCRDIDRLTLIVESEQFEEVAEGEPFPELEVFIATVRHPELAVIEPILN